MNNISIAIINGTSRKNNQSIHVSRLLESLLKNYDGVTTHLVQPSDFSFPLDGNKAEDSRDPRFTELTAKVDAFIIVSPEYNHTFTGSLKRMLDSEYENYMHKPVLLAGVSDGKWGGVRAIESLLHVVKAVGLLVVKYDLQFPLIESAFDDKGNFVDTAYIEKIHKSLHELVWLTRVILSGKAAQLKEK